MAEQVTYVVSWTTDTPAGGDGGGGGGNRRTFEEWEPAIALYDEVVADRRTDQARLVEVIEREVRCYQHEPRHA